MEANQKQDTKFIRKLGRVMHQYHMLGQADRILVGLSGGIDSMSLLHALLRRRALVPVRFDLVAVHVHVAGVPNVVDVPHLEAFCRYLGIELVQLHTAVDYSTDHRHTPCYLCASYRRQKVFEYAQQHGFAKLAFAHHLDDLLETLVLNMTQRAELSTMPPRLVMRNWAFELIRPFCEHTKAEIVAYAHQHGIVPAEGRCQYECHNSRGAVAKLLEGLQTLNPQAKANWYRALSHIVPDYLPGASLVPKPVVRPNEQ